jgi:hypothetical protein
MRERFPHPLLHKAAVTPEWSPLRRETSVIESFLFAPPKGRDLHGKILAWM